MSTDLRPWTDRWRRLWVPARQRPDFWWAYQAQVRTQHRSRTPLADVRFVVLDTESTGLDVRTDRVLSIAAVGVRDGRIHLADAFECLVAQAWVGSSSVAVHGILPQASQEGVSEATAIRGLVHYLQGAVLVAHHAEHDLQLLNRMIKRHFRARLLNRVVDTAQLARRVAGPALRAAEAPDTAAYDLDSLLARYGIAGESRHTAAGDAFSTAVLLLHLLAQLHERGVRTLGDLLWRTA